MAHPRSLPSVERSIRGRTPRASQALRRGRSSAVTVRSRGRLFSNGLVRPGGPGSGSTACGLRLVFDRERGADLPIDSPVFGDRTPLWEVGLPGARAPGLVLTLGRGTSLRSFKASQPFTLVRVVNGLEGTVERGSTVLTARRRVWAWWARKCLTRKGPEVTVRSTSPFGGLCCASWRRRQKGRSRVCRASFEVEHAAW